jgi:SagB-type dehydrogenase family enzyme
VGDILARRDAFAAPADSVAELYHENTKVNRVLGPNVLIPVEYAHDERAAIARAWKRFRLHERVALPAPDSGEARFDDVLAARRSERGFADADLGLAELAKVLHQSYGVTGELRVAGGALQKLRAAPSAGALYPAELYLGVRRVAGLEPGLYHYEVEEHALALLAAGDPTDELHSVCCQQPHARTASVIFLVAGAIQRTRRRYGERGYRYVLLDCGHLAGNLVLAATALGLATVTSCAFFDDAANELLRLDGLEEAVLYTAFLGPKEAG